MTDNEIITAFEEINYGAPETIRYGSPVPPTFVLACLKRLVMENDELFYKLQGVMWFVDKWLDGDELKQDEVSRASTMRFKTLQITEKQQAEVEGLKISVEALSRKVATARNDTIDEYTERLTRSISGCFHCADMQIIRAKMKDVAEQMKNNN